MRSTPCSTTAPHALTLIEMARSATANPAAIAGATAALALFRSWCVQSMPRIPGCDTALRLAIRIDRGMTIEQAAAREYGYRWQLFLNAWINHGESRSRARFVRAAMIYPAPQLLGV